MEGTDGWVDGWADRCWLACGRAGCDEPLHGLLRDLVLDQDGCSKGEIDTHPPVKVVTGSGGARQGPSAAPWENDEGLQGDEQRSS